MKLVVVETFFLRSAIRIFRRRKPLINVSARYDLVAPLFPSLSLSLSSLLYAGMLRLLAYSRQNLVETAGRDQRRADL